MNQSVLLLFQILTALSLGHLLFRFLRHSWTYPSFKLILTPFKASLNGCPATPPSPPILALGYSLVLASTRDVEVLSLYRNAHRLAADCKMLTTGDARVDVGIDPLFTLVTWSLHARNVGINPTTSTGVALVAAVVAAGSFPCITAASGGGGSGGVCGSIVAGSLVELSSSWCWQQLHES